MTENLDILQLFCRNFVYISDNQLKEYYIQSALNETLELFLDNLEAMSIGLQDAEEEQAELFIDFGNIYLPLFLRLDQEQIVNFSDKFIYKLTSKVPEHEEAYELIAIALTFIDDSFPGKVFKHLRSKLLNFEVNGVG